LIAYRPDWWKNAVTVSGKFQGETIGMAYLRSMREELKQMGGKLVLIDVTEKPNYKQGGTQLYGSSEGTYPSLDPLLPLFKEAFPNKQYPNRFTHAWNELETRLIPLIRKRIEAAFEKKKLPKIPFKVMLEPALLQNIRMMYRAQSSSKTNTFEWSSTPLIDQDGKETEDGHRLLGGYSGLGGSAYVFEFSRSAAFDYRGARPAVVF
jgi:hypothetical protein